MTSFKLTTKERRAFIWVRDQLRDGKLKYLPMSKINGGTNGIKSRLKSVFRYFNMEMWATKKEKHCGSVCCIGGWVEAKLQRPLRASLLFDARTLFHPHDTGTDWDKITPKRAARAIENYLKNGTPRWS